MTVLDEPPVAQKRAQQHYRNNAELWHRLGEVPLDRIIVDPKPGSVDYSFYAKIDGRWNDQLVELVDRTLVEKAMGRKESEIGFEVGRILANAIKAAKLGGKMSGADGMVRMSSENVRMPDFSWTTEEDIRDRERQEAAPREAPTLAVEVISPDNTAKEMAIKLSEYFDSGCRLAWLLYPETKTVHVYTSAEQRRELGSEDQLDAGDLIPNFSVKVATLFDV
ncbi:MAG: Uma2 family endonuclease [Planctomycetota bacterium]